MANKKSLISGTDNIISPIFLELYGDNPIVLNVQAERYKSLINFFVDRFGEGDMALFSSPGRTEIGGNHTDHNHGRVLAGAVNLDNIAVAAKNGTNIISVMSVGYPEFQIDLSNLAIDRSEHYTSSSLVRGICARLKETGHKVGGFNVCIDGRVPKGSGLSSSASFEVLIGTIVNHLFNEGKIGAVETAIVGQLAENNYFGKPCGLMDQTACAVGGLITIDFKDPSKPIVKEIDFDFMSTGYSLVITEVGGGHDDAASQAEYASLPTEMRAVAKELGAEYLREVSLEQIVSQIPEIRSKTGDRAILRAYHFQNDNQRVADQVDALERGDFNAFLRMVIESGYSSFMYNQNIFDIVHKDEQVVSLGLALSEMVLKGYGAWRVHGGGFGGTIQAFVPKEKLDEYVTNLENVFGKGKCNIMFIRSKGSIKLDL